MASPIASRRFDWDFFQNHLVVLVDQWRSSRGLKPTDAIVVLRTIRGKAFTVDGISVAGTWIVVFTESEEMHFVPMDEVALVTVQRRPEPAPDKVVGFHQEPSVGSGTSRS
jgi:hypothetical protein